MIHYTSCRDCHIITAFQQTERTVIYQLDAFSIASRMNEIVFALEGCQREARLSPASARKHATDIAEAPNSILITTI